MNLIYGADEQIAAWVVSNIPRMAGGVFGPGRAIGVADSADRIIAGVVFHDYQPTCKTIQISMAASTPKWATRRTIAGLLRYPFHQLGVNKVWTASPASNTRAIRFNEGIGFKREAVLERHFGDDDAVICCMFVDEFNRRFAPAILH